MKVIKWRLQIVFSVNSLGSSDQHQQFQQGSNHSSTISSDFFNFVIESILRKAGVHSNGMIFSKSIQLFTYADNIDNIERTECNVTYNASLSMLTTSKNVRRIASRRRPANITSTLWTIFFMATGDFIVVSVETSLSLMSVKTWTLSPKFSCRLLYFAQALLKWKH